MWGQGSIYFLSIVNIDKSLASDIYHKPHRGNCLRQYISPPRLRNHHSSGILRANLLCLHFRILLGSLFYAALVSHPLLFGIAIFTQRFTFV